MAIAVFNGSISASNARATLTGLGKMFSVTQPTPGTAIAYANKVAFSATANGLFSISNGNPVGGPTIQLDRLKLIQTATAPTGTLTFRHEIYTESGIMVIGTAAAAVTPINLNPNIPTSTGATVTFFNAGAGTVPAAVGTRRLVEQGWMPTGVTVAHDSFTWDFGADDVAKNGGAAARATDPAHLVVAANAVTIPPQYSAYMNLWWITSAANIPSFEWQLTYAEQTL